MSRLQTNDRVLILSPETLDRVEAIANALTQGVLVVVGNKQMVTDGRKRFRDIVNVMFLQESEDGVIPWRNAFFTKAMAKEDSPEVRRVLALDGSFETL